jgi:hypothetical protein
MFDDDFGQRSVIEGVDPASIRLRGYQRRNLNTSHLGSKIDDVQVKDQSMLNDKRLKDLDDERCNIPRGISSTCLG